MLSPLAVGQPQSVAAGTGVCIAGTFTAGGFDSAAISSGKLYMWGNNTDGQLGVGFSGGGLHPTPLPVVTSTGLSGPTAAWTSGSSSFAVDPSGQLWGWGSNFLGQLGQPTSVSSLSSPTQITGPTHVIQVSGGGGDTIALTGGGTVWGWGNTADGELGFVSSSPQTTPVVLPVLTNIAEVSAGAFTSVALGMDGTVYGSGQNIGGELGLGSGVSKVTAFQPLPGLSKVRQVVISESGFFSAFVVAADQGGHVFAAGNNQDGEMGNGSPSSTNQSTFAQVPNIDSVTAVAVGDAHVMALKLDGTVWAWGSNFNGQLGNGTLNDSATPVQVSFPAGTQLVAIAAGFAHSMALDNTGTLWSWGSNSLGELGTGTAGGFMTTPVKVAITAVDKPCGGPVVPLYVTSVNGYQFVNDGGITAPSYERMAEFYPSSRGQMFYSLPFGITTESVRGAVFYNTLFKPAYVGYPQLGGAGLCYGMVASNQFLFSQFPDKPVFTIYHDGLSSKFPGDLGASPSPSDQNIEQFIDRYHAKQLAASGALASIQSWNNIEDAGGNRAALAAIAKDLTGGRTEWLGLGPTRRLLNDGPLGKARFLQLFNVSHSVLAYGVNLAKLQVNVYDPNDPGGDRDIIQLVDLPGVPGGGIFLNHPDRNEITYGGGLTSSGEDLGFPGEWTLMPLPVEAFTDAGIVAGQDNKHWVLDAKGAVAAAFGVKLPMIGGIPVFRITDANEPAQALIEMLPDGTGFEGTITTVATGAQTLQITGAHAAQVTETDSAAAGTTHQVTLSPDASQIALSNASSAQQYTAMLAADFLPSFGRRMTVSGATLMPGGTLDIGTDLTYSLLNLSSSSMATEQASLLLEQLGQGAGSTSVGVTIPGAGSQGAVFVGDWTSLRQSLVFEAVTAPNGKITSLLLQDNPSQRQQLTDALLQSVRADIGQVEDAGVRNSLQAKFDNATKQVAGGDPRTAANVLEALNNEVAAQNGVTIPSEQAASIQGSLRELIGLLRAPLAQ